jgi:hypothetical protein
MTHKRVDRAANPENTVPKTDVARVISRHVHLDKDSTWQHVVNRDEHIGELSNAPFTFVSHLDDRLWVISILEVRTHSRNRAEDLADNARAWRDVDSFARLIYALWKENDFASGVLLQYRIDRGTIVV